MKIFRKISVAFILLLISLVGSCGLSVRAQAPEELQFYLSNANVYTHTNEAVELPEEVFYSLNNAETFGKLKVNWASYSPDIFQQTGIYEIKGRTEIGNCLVKGYIHVSDHKIVAAAIGDSLTAGSGLPQLPSKNGYSTYAYPSVLERMLGKGYEVLNFGVPGATLSDYGTLSYKQTERYAYSLETNFDLLIVQLGTNDNHEKNWSNTEVQETFKEQYIAFLKSYAEMNKDAAIYLCLVPDAAELSRRNIVEILPKIIETAKESKLNITVVDQYSITRGKTGTSLYQSDEIHLSKSGAELIATNIYNAVRGN